MHIYFTRYKFLDSINKMIIKHDLIQEKIEMKKRKERERERKLTPRHIKIPLQNIKIIQFFKDSRNMYRWPISI